MGRYARNTIADVPYHVINRGNNHQSLFFCVDDYLFFFESLEWAKKKYPCKIFSFVFMTNHIHLLLEPVGDGGNMANFMKYVSQRHGQYINKHYKRSGTLWEGRFKSSPVSVDRYLLACSRYIEMNSVRAAIVEKPEDYAFSSYGTKAGLQKLSFLDSDSMYTSLGNTDHERQVAYRNWFHESIPKEEWKLIREAVQRNWAYGNSPFKDKMEKVLKRRFEIRKAGRRPKI